MKNPPNAGPDAIIEIDEQGKVTVPDLALDRAGEIRREERGRCAALVREAGCSRLAMCAHYQARGQERHDPRCPLALAAYLEAE